MVGVVWSDRSGVIGANRELQLDGVVTTAAPVVTQGKLLGKVTNLEVRNVYGVNLLTRTSIGGLGAEVKDD